MKQRCRRPRLSAGLAFFVVSTNYSRRLSNCLIIKIIGTYSSGGDVRFGSLAVIQTHISLMSAIGRIADIQTSYLAPSCRSNGSHAITDSSEVISRSFIHSSSSAENV